MDISGYKNIVLSRFKEIASQAVTIRRFNITIVPWENWGKSSPKWWHAYNDVKHSRLLKYRSGNLENVWHAVAGLGVIMQFLGSVSVENFRGFFFSNLRFLVLPWNQ
jgi:hypothetical protein